MDLSNPAALWLLGIIGIFLLLPRAPRPRLRKPVANLYMWVAAETPSEARLRRPPFSWVVLLQGMILLLLIAAIAKPAMLRSARDIAIVVDVSASMGATHERRTRLDLARDQALALIDELPRGSRVHLFAAGPTVTDLGAYSASERALRTRVEGLRTGAGASSLETAVRATQPSAEVHVFTDQPRAGEAARWVRVGSAGDNVAITAFSGRRLRNSALDAELLVEVHNFGEAARQIPLLIRHGSTVIHREVMTLAPHGSQSAVMYVTDPSGAYSTEIEVDDALAVDNRRFTIVSALPRSPVLVATHGHYFLEQALAANQSIEVLPDASKLSDAAGVVVCERCEDVPPTVSGVLMLLPPRQRRPAILRVAAMRHPVMDGIALNDFHATVDAAASAPAGATVLIQTGDVPVVFAAERNGRRTVYLQFDVDSPVAALDFAFPLLISNAIGWLAGAGEIPAMIEAGEPAVWRMPPEGEVVTTPSGRTMPVVRSRAGSAFTATDEAGVYLLTRRGTTTPAFVVNPTTRSESDLSAVYSTDTVTAKPVHDGRTRTDLVTACIVLGLLLALTDWWIHVRTSVAQL